MTNVFEIFAKISLDSSEYDKGLKAASDNTDSFGSKLKGGLSTAVKAGAVALTAATGAVVGFGASSISAGKDFDTAMSQVAATMGVTTSEIQDLRDYAIEMGSKTAFSATESAEALNYMALAGYDASTSMDMLPTVLNLAAAGNIDLANASDMVTDAQSALGLSLDETRDMVDKMAMASSKSNTSVAQLGEAFLTVGGTAKNLSGGTTELATALGILADNGIKGSEGGTALRNIILSLSAPTDKAAAKMEALGLQVFDANGNMRPLNDTFNDLNKILGTMTQQERTEVLNILFNKVDLKSANALLANSGKRFDELSGYIDEARGSAEKMAEVQLDNLAGDITLFKSALEGAQIAISDRLTPSLRDFVQFGTDGLSRLTDAFNEEGLSGAISVFGDLVNEGIDMFLEGLPKAIDAGAQLLGAIAQGIFDNLPKLAQTALDIILSLANGISNHLPALIARLPEIIVGIVTFIANNLPAIIETGINIIVALIEGLANAIPELIKYTPQILLAIAKGIIQSIKIIIERGPDIVSALVKGIAGAYKALFTVGGEVLSKISEGIKGGFGKITDNGRQLVDKLRTSVKTAAVNLVTSGKELIEKIGQGIKNNLSAVSNKIFDLRNKIKETVIGLATSWVYLGYEIVKGIADGITKYANYVINAITGLVSSAWNKVKSFFGISSPSKLMKWAGQMLDEGFAKGILDEVDQVSDAMDELNGVAIAPIESGFSTTGSPYNASNNTANYGGITMNIYGAVGQDVNELAEIISEKLSTAVDRRRLTFA